MNRSLLACLASVALARGVGQVAKAMQLPQWQRTSFNGGTVSLSGGAQVVIGMGGGALAIPDKRLRSASLIALGAGASAGYIDDHLESRFPAQGKGFHGHLGALKSGKITSGVAKIAIIGSGATLASMFLNRPRSWRDLFALGVDTALIAGSANLINLLDLRPGRALKVSVISAGVAGGLVQSSRVASASVVGSALGTLPEDLRGETMLGDLGANALGGQLGVILCQAMPLSGRCLALAGVIGLTGLSEKVSFSHVIEHNSVFHFLDQLGRS